MSIRVTSQNDSRSGSTQIKYTLPSGAASKPANTGFIMGIWCEIPAGDFISSSKEQHLLSAGTGDTDNNSSALRFRSNTDNLQLFICNSSGSVVGGAPTVSNLTRGLPYCVMVISTATNTHLVAQSVDGTSTILSSTGSGDLRTNAFTQMIGNIGGGTDSNNWPYISDMEGFFYIQGDFPETAGVPDAALIADIANGARPINTIVSALTGGVNVFSYKTGSPHELEDDFGNHADLTLVNANVATGFLNITGKQMRPDTLTATASDPCVSQVVFGTAGDASTAFADIPVPSGIYTGILPDAIQARLHNEDGTVHTDWTVIDAAPSGGTWAAGVIPNVPMTAGFLSLSVRAVDKSVLPMSDVIWCGTRGAGFNIVCSGQSQLMYNFANGSGQAAVAGSRALLGSATSITQMFDIGGNSASSTLGGRFGARQIVKEINTLFPGVPVQCVTIGRSGTSLAEMLTTYAGYPQTLRDSYGVEVPLRFATVGHSEAAGAGYETEYTDYLEDIRDILGTHRVLCIPVPRYKGAGATLTGNAAAVDNSRNGMRQWYEAHSDESTWGYSLSSVNTENEGTATSDPHPSDDLDGQGRTGAIIAWALLSDVNAVDNPVIEIVGARTDGTSAFLELGEA